MGFNLRISVLTIWGLNYITVTKYLTASSSLIIMMLIVTIKTLDSKENRAASFRSVPQISRNSFSIQMHSKPPSSVARPRWKMSLCRKLRILIYSSQNSFLSSSFPESEGLATPSQVLYFPLNISQFLVGQCGRARSSLIRAKSGDG